MSRVNIDMPEMRINGILANGIQYLSVDGICKWLADVEDAFRAAGAHEYATEGVTLVRKRLSNAEAMPV